jgi:hypothetical protein
MSNGRHLCIQFAVLIEMMWILYYQSVSITLYMSEMIKLHSILSEGVEYMQCNELDALPNYMYAFQADLSPYNLTRQLRMLKLVIRKTFFLPWIPF